MIITVSGKAYYAVLDPLTTDVPGERGWPAASFRRKGRGTQAVYDVTIDQARDIQYQLRMVGEDFAGFGTDDETRAEGRACLAAADSIDRQLAKAAAA